jgi:two-component system, NarL family, invasion response regulator UvrY
MEKPHSIFLVEDHIVVRKGIKELIENMGNYKIAAEFDNGEELTRKIPNAKPDIIIMDLTMPVMDGAAAMTWMKEHDIKTPVLILTLDTSDEMIIKLYKLGVRGYLPKTCSAPTLKKAIDDIITSGYYHNELLFNALRKEDEKPKKDNWHAVFNDLPEREREFIRLVCDSEEYTYEQIADIMNVRPRTVDGYRETVFETFGVKSKTGLVLFAIKYGLVAI